MSRRLTTSEFIEKAKSVHGDKYDYSKSIYTRTIDKVIIICNTCKKEFKQRPNGHLGGKGCLKCNYKIGFRKQSLQIDDFIHRSKIKHGDKYDYKLVEYKSVDTKVKIICQEHGIFLQTPYTHMQGHGCMGCRLKNSSGWSLKSWIKSANNSKFFDSFKVYIVRCWNDKEEFFKIGRTYKKTSKRFHKSRMPYKYEIVKELTFSKGEDCYYTEKEILKSNSKYSYNPTLDFPGKHECFSKIDDLTLT